MRKVISGIIVMVIGLLLLFAMVAGMIESGIVRSLAAYTAAFGGLMYSVFAVVRRINPRL